MLMVALTRLFYCAAGIVLFGFLFWHLILVSDLLLASLVRLDAVQRARAQAIYFCGAATPGLPERLLHLPHRHRLCYRGQRLGP